MTTYVEYAAPHRHAQTTWWGHLLWLLAATVGSWAMTASFAGGFHLSRSLFLVPYVVLTAIFLVGYWRWGDFNLRHHLVDNWGWGVVATLLVHLGVNRPTMVSETVAQWSVTDLLSY